MIKFILQMFAALALVISGALFTVGPANAAPTFTAVQAQPASAVTQVSTKASIPLVAPQSPSVPMPKVIGNGGIKPLYQWLPPQYCYWSTGIQYYSYYCYRYNCTYFEKVAWGCYDGYVRINTVSYA